MVKNDEKWNEKRNNLCKFGWAVLFFSVKLRYGYVTQLVTASGPALDFGWRSWFSIGILPLSVAVDTTRSAYFNSRFLCTCLSVFVSQCLYLVFVPLPPPLFCAPIPLPRALFSSRISPSSLVSVSSLSPNLSRPSALYVFCRPQ